MDMRNFDILSEEKRRTILNSAFTCFGKDGYKKTAMSEIAGLANISKASLFHYFGTKKNLFFYLFGFSCNEILAKLKSGTEDFFECVELSMRLKMEVTDKYPSMFGFLNSLAYENDTSIITELQNTYGDAINEWTTTLFVNVDWSRFLPEIDKEKAYNLVNWISDGYAKSYSGKKDHKTTITELKSYLDLIRRSTYKEKYL